ncbi:MAG TPA: preprotein translocase subunit SecE [Puia sp.]|nr:preprotein translocase subunit SecE [Puia sp.]
MLSNIGGKIVGVLDQHIGKLANYQIIKMNKVATYFRESYKELLEKVTWPNWTQLQQSTIIVLVATLLITSVVWVMDMVASGLLKFIYSFFSK